ncbi:PfkB family carbohydrate kinase [Demetria terragena]|uniref:PfkB family carbohydrate kinase n=1 Tax=Demetria terragena TaxID=63959 RepID=UPI00036003D8|nr:PfkB family carbohydrate kinase [Demetria terragena]
MGARTLVIGEALVDIVREPDGAQHEHVGGSPLNVAVGLARLGHDVELATRIGEDDHGRLIEEHLGHDFVPLSPGSHSTNRTATAIATTDESGAAEYEFAMEWDLGAVPTGFQHVHTGSIAAVMQPGATAVRTALEQARATATLSYDPNSRPTLMGEPHDVRQEMEQLIGLSDVVKASDEDIEWLYDGTPLEEIARLWGRLGPLVIVVTRGADGALVYLPRADDMVSVEGRPAEVADTVGAGDSFMSGLLSGLLDHGLLGGTDARERLAQDSREPVLDAVHRAIYTSSITVSRPGAQPPRRDELV